MWKELDLGTPYRTNPNDEPIIDEYTRKITYAIRDGDSITSTGAVGTCSCGAYEPDKRCYIGIGGQIYVTNSLAIHRLAYHRHEIPNDTLNIIQKIKGEEEPTQRETRENEPSCIYNIKKKTYAENLTGKILYIGGLSISIAPYEIFNLTKEMTKSKDFMSLTLGPKPVIKIHNK